ncbi:MAG: hypothetical protein ACFFB0_04700 [Promethearchaeota archaeon]
MGKGSGLAVFALLIGIGGLGFGIYTYFTFNQTIEAMQGDIDKFEVGSYVHRTYYDNRTAYYTATMSDSWYEIPDLSILFKVEPGESVYFLFTCRAYLHPDSSTWFMRFRLIIDDVAIDRSATTVGGAGTLTYIYYSITLQYTDISIPAGNHEVKVDTMRECDDNSYIDHCSLLVQTYIP